MNLGSLYDEALPTELFACMQQSILGHPDIQRLYENSFWFPIDAEPRLSVEHAVRALMPLLPFRDGLQGAEWWVPALRPTQGMEWHCDCDRIVYAREKRFVRPKIGSVLYLDDVGGPTIIVDDVATDSHARRPRSERGGVGYLPMPNRYGVFPGDRFHAVAISNCDRLRVTVAINWWAEKPNAPLCIEPPYEATFLAPLTAPVDAARRSGAARVAAPIVFSPELLAALPHRRYCPIYPRVAAAAE